MTIIVTTSDYWRKKLADPSARLPVFEDEPQPGRYRVKNGAGWSPVAIWRVGDEVFMLKDDFAVEPEKMPGVWVGAAKTPISADEYDRMVRGAASPDMLYSALPAESGALVERARALGAIPLSIDNRDDAARLADLAHALKAIETRAEETRKELGAPHVAALKVINDEWAEPAALAKAARAPVMAALATWLEKQNMPGGVKGQLGKAISLRTDSAVEVTDYEAALAHFVATAPREFDSLVEKLARAAMKDGQNVPGVRIVQRRRAQ